MPDAPATSYVVVLDKSGRSRTPALAGSKTWTERSGKRSSFRFPPPLPASRLPSSRSLLLSAAKDCRRPRQAPCMLPASVP
jgi:hypothetical protein